MPVSYFPPHQIWQLVAFVKSLSRPSGGVSIAGNASSGAKLFRQIGCSNCYVAGGEGGRIGPELSNIGAIRSPAYLRTALVDPNANSITTYRAVRMVDITGH